MASFNQGNCPPNVYKMMERLGIERGGGVLPRLGLVYASAVRTCHQCERSDVCHEWLKVASTAFNVPPKFCPNADLFTQLAFDQPSAWCTNIAHEDPRRRPASISV